MSQVHYVCEHCGTETGIDYHTTLICLATQVQQLKTKLREARAEGMREAAEIALKYGYTLDFDREHQPWAREANTWLRTQNKAVSERILAAIKPGDTI